MTLAVAYLQQNTPPGNVYSDIAFSGYITWKTNTSFKIFLDPRFELYPPKQWQDYLQINSAASNWEELLSEYHVCILVLSPKTQSELIKAALKSERWQHTYKDDMAELFIRRVP